MERFDEIDSKGLRQFGLQTGAVVALLFGLVLPWVFDLVRPVWPWVVGGVLILWGAAAPASLRPVYRGWMRLAVLISRVTTPLVLGLVYFAMITPVGVMMRLAGRDALARRFDAAKPSYRIPSRRRSREHMEKPY